MGSLRRTGAWLGLAEDGDEDLEPEVDGHYADDPPRRGDQWHRRYPAPDARAARHAPGTRTPAHPPRLDIAAAADDQEFHIATIHARGFRDARTIGEYYRQDVPVVMDLTGLEDPDQRRIVDFAAGLIFGRRGNIHRLARGVFLLSPVGTAILSGDNAPATGGDFFDQS